MLEEFLSFTGLVAVVDILIVATLFYWLMLLIKGTRASRMVWGIGIIVVLYFVSQRAGLMTLHWILDYFLGSIIIVIIVVFQQDIKRGLVKMGGPFSSRGLHVGAEFIDEIAGAASALSIEKTGALVAIERKGDLIGVAEAGTWLDSRVSKELLMAIFNPDSPLHDGAVIVKDHRITRAGTILPLTDRELDRSLGTRHRAALGLTEEADSVVVVVSEKTGEISVAVGGSLEGGYDYERLVLRLKELFISATEPGHRPWWYFYRGTNG